MKYRPIRMLVCGHDLKFLKPFLSRLEHDERYELRVLTHEGHYLNDHQRAQHDLDWADIIFCEWALDNAVWFSQRKRSDQVLIVRLHLQEVQARERIDFIYATDWSKVDRLILITQHLYDWMRREFRALGARSALVYNPIPATGALSLPKPDEARYVLGLVGVVPARKRLDLAVAVLKRLRASDSRYRLRVKGALPQDYPWMSNRKDEVGWYSKVFDDLAELRNDGAIIFDPHGPDMADWYQGVGHILSVSDFEGSHQAVAEGMAAGCIPAIRDWEGADRIYPRSYVAGTVEDLAAMIERHAGIDVFERESIACREFASRRFDETPVCEALLSVIDHEMLRLRPLDARSRTRAGCARPTFLIVAYIPLGTRSGYRIRVEQEIQILVQMGCIVHLACLLPPVVQGETRNTAESQLARDAHAEEFSALGAYVHLVEIEDFFCQHVKPESFPETVARLIEIASESRVDVLHAEALYCARLGSLVKARMPGLRFSIDWHGAVPEESRLGGAHENRVKALESAERNMFACADLNVFVSETMARHYSSKYALGQVHQVIVPCCVADQRFVKSAGAGDSAFGLDSLVFAYAGSMADWQCGPEMIKLFAALYRFDARCRFLLLVPTSDHEKVLHFAQAARLPDEAYLLQAVAHNDVPTRLATAHMGVLLRRTDVINAVSSPTKLGEYLAAGIPVLMTDGIGDFSDLVVREEVGFILPQELLNDADDEIVSLWLKRIVEQVLYCRSARRHFAERCQKIASTQLQWEEAAMRWLKAYGPAG